MVFLKTLQIENKMRNFPFKIAESNINIYIRKHFENSFYDF